MLFWPTFNLAWKEVNFNMPSVRIREGESFETAIKRFKKQCEKGGVLAEIRKREHYEKPSVKRKKKALAARKRALKRAMMTDKR